MISKQLSQYLKYFIFFLIVALLIAPAWHEFIHITVLTFYGCYYSFSFAFDWIHGFYMLVTPLCDLSVAQSLVALSSSFFGNLAVGFILFLSSYIARIKEKINLSNYLIYAAVGFLIEPMFCMLAIRGNTVEILNLSGASNMIWILPIIGFIIFLLALIYFWFHIKHVNRYQSLFSHSSQSLV